MAEIRSTTKSTLFRPVNASEVFVDQEWSLYDERMHWAKLIKPFLETLGALILITVAVERTFTSFNIATLVIGAAYLYYRWANPPRNHKSARWPYAIFAAGLAYSWVQSGAGAGMMVILAVTIRFIVYFLEWLLYERLFITNRRVILAKGLLGSDFSTMPLTRLTDIKYNTTIPGEILGYATVQVETAGQDQALSRLDFLASPIDFYTTLIHLSTSAVGSVTGVTDEDLGNDLDGDLPGDPHGEIHRDIHGDLYGQETDEGLEPRYYGDPQTEDPGEQLPPY